MRRSMLAVGMGLGLVASGLGPLATPAEAIPSLSPTTVVSGLSYPWDLTWVNGAMLYTVRGGAVYSKRNGSSPARVSLALPPVFVNGEGGLLGIVADPRRAGEFFTCLDVETSAGNAVDVRVLRWKLTSDRQAVPITNAATGSNVVVRGFPVTSGRHSGCRLRFGADDKLYVGTGDAAVATAPQSLSSLGGKVLRVNRDGSIPTDNPFYARGGNARYVWAYGHRNIQGLALRPGTSQIWSAEHGTYRDDEINLNRAGGNYGYDPGPGYDESVPMTDLTKFPNAVSAVWSSGSSTIATSGITFLTGPAWGRWQGAIATGVLKGRGIMVLSLNPGGGQANTEWVGAAGRGDRIRTVQQGPDGALYYTTSNGPGKDRIARLAPTPARTLPAYRKNQDVSPVAPAAARDGSTFYVAIRSAGNKILIRRSTDNARTWSTWIDTGVVSSSSPGLTVPAAGRLVLGTRSSANALVLSSLDATGRRTGYLTRPGTITSAPSLVSAGDGTYAVYARDSNDAAVTQRFDGSAFTGWTSLGGIFSTAVTASIDTRTKITTLTGRSRDQAAYEKTLAANGSASTGWRQVQRQIYSARALGSTYGSGTRVGVTSGSDGYAVVDRGALIQGISTAYSSAPAVVTRTDGTWVMFGRGSGGALSAYDARAGGYRSVSLGRTLQ